MIPQNNENVLQLNENNKGINIVICIQPTGLFYHHGDSKGFAKYALFSYNCQIDWSYCMLCLYHGRFITLDIKLRLGMVIIIVFYNAG